MKRLLLLILTIISISVFGQVQLIGIQGGVNITNQSSPNTFKDSKYRTGIIGGLNYEFIFKVKYALGADLLNRQQGFTINQPFTDVNGNLTGKSSGINFNYDYLSLPLKIGCRFGIILRDLQKLEFALQFC